MTRPRSLTRFLYDREHEIRRAVENALCGLLLLAGLWAVGMLAAMWSGGVGH